MTDVANGNHQEMARTRAPGRATSKHPRADSDNEPNANEIKLRSIEGNLYVVPAEAACLSMKVKRMVDEHKYQPFSLCISSNDLEKVIEFWKLTQNDSSPAAHAEFISQFDDETLFNTMVTARDLEVKSLLELTVNTNTIRVQIRSFTPRHDHLSLRRNTQSFVDSKQKRRKSSTRGCSISSSTMQTRPKQSNESRSS